MLRSLIVWKITYIAYATAFLIAFLLIAIQIFRLGNIIFGLPPSTSLSFLFLWLGNYSLFFLPDGVFAASVITAFWLKERKLLHVIYSFGISPKRLLLYVLLPSLLFTLLQLSFSFTLHEEKVAFTRKSLLLKHKDRLIENLPPKTFFRTGNVVIYAENKGRGGFRNLFFKSGNLTVLAREAVYEGNEVFTFYRGSLLTRESGKFLLTEFEKYRLDLKEESQRIGYRKERVRRGIAMNLINSLTTVPMGALGFLITLRFISSYLRSYYLIAAGIVIHQLLMMLVKLSL